MIRFLAILKVKIKAVTVLRSDHTTCHMLRTSQYYNHPCDTMGARRLVIGMCILMDDYVFTSNHLPSPEMMVPRVWLDV